jgi:hypothetical protein
MPSSGFGVIPAGRADERHRQAREELVDFDNRPQTQVRVIGDVLVFTAPECD